MLSEQYYTAAQFSDILSVSKETLRRWATSGKLIPVKVSGCRQKVYTAKQLEGFEEAQSMLSSEWDSELNVTPTRDYTLVELFAGAGGLALGLEKSGFQSLMLNELDKNACETLRRNRPEWNVVEGDVANVDFSKYAGEVDLLTGGFPCQAFSYAGKSLGFADTRGTLFFEMARAISECKPKVFLAENVRALISHDQGRTLETIRTVIRELGYILVEPKVLKAIFYKVPQKRERLFLVAIREDFADQLVFKWPSPYKRPLVLRDAFKAGELYDVDVPRSAGQEYPLRKKEIMQNVPEGGYWRDLPDELQREYMKKSYFLGGGKTGMARRLSMEEPSLTLTTSPAQKQTERCHPIETRPLQVREYARIQTFPDDWEFCGPLSAQYKQIGNAVPVNLAAAMGRSLVRMFNELID